MPLAGRVPVPFTQSLTPFSLFAIAWKKLRITPGRWPHNTATPSARMAKPEQ